jgi:CheY-like chemotaxis protein
MEQNTVLVVEDNKDIREGLQFFLEDEGYCVVTAHDGQVALDLIPTLPNPAVILLDLKMPKVDGYGVLRNLADNPEQHARHPIFLLTANVSQLSPEMMQLLGREGVPVLPKPFELEHLKEQIRNAFDRTEEQHES